MANLRIDIASEFTGGRAFKQAEAATGSLDKAITSLGKKLAGAFSVYKLAQFGKASVKAFMEDEQAAKSLANQLRNIGYGSATAGAEQFIATMEKTTGVMDDKLRPAYAQLARVTGSMGKTQSILNTAWNVASGTGQDITSVVDALSQAYVGNTRGLKSLNLGLTKAELATKSFDEIMTLLNSQFSGAGQAAINSYAGQVALLQVGVQNAMENIGKSIVDAFGIINGDQGIGGTLSAIENVSNKIGDFIRQTAAGAGILATAFDPKNWFNPERMNKKIDAILKDYSLKQSIANQQRVFKEWVPNFAWTPEQKKAEAEAKKRAAELTALIKKQTLAQKDLVKQKKEAAALDALSLKYLEAQKIFNQDQIQIAAALQNKGLSAEDALRVSLKKDLLDLETAIQNKDVEGATALANKISLEIKQLGLYQQAESALTKIQSIIGSFKPLDLINLTNLQDALAMLAKMNVPVTPAQKATTSTAQAAVDTYIASKVLGVDLANAAAEMDVTSALGVPFNPNVVSNYGVGNPNLITIKVENNTGGVADVIMDVVQQQSANGVSSRIIRNTGNLNW